MPTYAPRVRLGAGYRPQPHCLPWFPQSRHASAPSADCCGQLRMRWRPRTRRPHGIEAWVHHSRDSAAPRLRRKYQIVSATKMHTPAPTRAHLIPDSTPVDRVAHPNGSSCLPRSRSCINGVVSRTMAETAPRMSPKFHNFRNLACDRTCWPRLGLPRTLIMPRFLVLSTVLA